MERITGGYLLELANKHISNTIQRPSLKNGLVVEFMPIHIGSLSISLFIKPMPMNCNHVYARVFVGGNHVETLTLGRIDKFRADNEERVYQFCDFHVECMKLDKLNKEFDLWQEPERIAEKEIRVYMPNAGRRRRLKKCNHC